MADKDLSTRGKEEVAYFVPLNAASYACFGRVGHHYSFSKKEPVRVTLACDIEMFRMKRDIGECDASGSPLGQADEGAKPLSYSKTAPPDSAGKEEGAAGPETETLTTDKSRKGKASGKKKEKKKKKGKKEGKEKASAVAAIPTEKGGDDETPPEKKPEGADGDDVDSVWD